MSGKDVFQFGSKAGSDHRTGVHHGGRFIRTATGRLHPAVATFKEVEIDSTGGACFAEVCLQANPPFPGGASSCLGARQERPSPGGIHHRLAVKSSLCRRSGKGTLSTNGTNRATFATINSRQQACAPKSAIQFE